MELNNDELKELIDFVKHFLKSKMFYECLSKKEKSILSEDLFKKLTHEKDDSVIGKEVEHLDFVSDWSGSIKYYKIKDDISLTLRGQPSRKSNMTVVRTVYHKGEWDINGTYTTGSSIISKLWDVYIEGSTNCKELYLKSKSKGWLCYPIEKNNFIKQGTVTSLNSLGNNFQNGDITMVLNNPKDITAVYLK